MYKLLILLLLPYFVFSNDPSFNLHSVCSIPHRNHQESVNEKLRDIACGKISVFSILNPISSKSKCRRSFKQPSIERIAKRIFQQNNTTLVQNRLLRQLNYIGFFVTRGKGNQLTPYWEYIYENSNQDFVKKVFNSGEKGPSRGDIENLINRIRKHYGLDEKRNISTVTPGCRIISLFPTDEGYYATNLYDNSNSEDNDSDTEANAPCIDCQNQPLPEYFPEITRVRSGRGQGAKLIKRISKEDLEKLPNLEYLDLARSRISQIEPEAFYNLPNLEYLTLYQNRINKIENGAFDGLSGLKRLRLHQNRISKIEPGAFEELESLESLRLDRNKITTIETGTFRGLSNLKRLDLYHNNITTIKRGDFEGLENLENLYLPSSIRDIEIEALIKDLPNLKRVWFIPSSDNRNTEYTSAVITKIKRYYGDSFDTIKVPHFRGDTWGL